MKKEVIEKLLLNFPISKHREIRLPCLPQGNWFLVKVSPFSSLEDLSLIIADIENNNNICLPPDLIVRHSDSCTAKNHKLTGNLNDAIGKLEQQVFHIALWEGNPGIYSGQPVAIPLDPEISYHVYPDHPHLNVGCKIPISQNESIYIPDSICYTHDVGSLGVDSYTKISEAIFEISLWLLRHQVWIATRELGRALWIGREVINADHARNITMALNPMGYCYCGSGKIYRDCHMKQNYQNYYGCSYADPNHYLRQWEVDRKFPHKYVMKELKRLLK